MTTLIQPIIFPILLISLYFLSRVTINEIFYFLRIFIHNDHIVFSFVSLIFFPGTALHEMSHFLAALILMLTVREVKIFPEWEKNYIKLGRVLYEKKDVFRGILVGLAPFFGGLAFFWWISTFNIFPTKIVYLNIIIGYIIFAVSSTMFSSKQDLIDLIYIIPFAIIVGGILYIFNIKPEIVLNNLNITNVFADITKRINLYLLFSLIINAIIIITFKSFRKIIKR